MIIQPDDYIPDVIGKTCDCGKLISDHNDDELDICWHRKKSKNNENSLLKHIKSRGLVSPMFGKNNFKDADDVIISKNRDAWNTCKFWLGDGFRGLYLWGKPGTGKTYAARSILYRAFKIYKIEPMDITAYSLLKSAESWAEVAQLSREAESVRLLLIDDIDKVEWRAKDLSYLWSLLNTRSENGGRTIITSNVKPENFRSIFLNATHGNDSKVEATFQRLHPVQTVEFKGGSVRSIVSNHG